LKLQSFSSTHPSKTIKDQIFTIKDQVLSKYKIEALVVKISRKNMLFFFFSQLRCKNKPWKSKRKSTLEIFVSGGHSERGLRRWNWRVVGNDNLYAVFGINKKGEENKIVCTVRPVSESAPLW